MSGDTDFTPRLGRIRDRGARGGKSFRQQVKQAAARLSKPAGKSGFTGRNIGRGNGATPQAMQSLRQITRARMRRVIVKVHIARARGGSGVRAFSEHVRYIQRDGVERDGSGGELYGREGQEVNGRDFAERSGDDRHQFRLTVSATVDLASGRMALIGNQKAFALVPWRPDLERQRGRSLMIEQRAKGLSWSFPSGRARGLSR